jgi:DNA-binding SARP family transcriptional activator
MEQREGFAPAAPRMSYSTLPFSLASVAPGPEPPLALVIGRLDLLQQLARDTRNEIDLLRRESAEVLRRVTTSFAAVDAPAAPAAEERAVVEPGLRFHLLGSFEIRAGGRAVTHGASRKPRLLLAFLAMDAKRLVPREVLIEQFWPESPVERGGNNLSIAIHHIRAWLRGLEPTGNDGICVRQGLYGLDPDAPFWVDVEEFRSNLSRGRSSLRQGDRDAARQHLAAAIDLYRGDFLESDPYEEWTVEPRRTFAEAYRWALAWLAAAAADGSDWLAVVDYAKRIEQRDPCDEEAHRWLIRAYWQTGRRSQALLQYRTCAERLREELGVSPSDETEELMLAVNGQQ